MNLKIVKVRFIISNKTVKSNKIISINKKIEFKLLYIKQK